jgi:hypothetical protein
MTNKSVQEFEIKFFRTYLNALLCENYVLKIIEVENNTLPNSITIEIDGVLKDFRLKPFQRQNERGNFIENVYILMS